MSNEQQRKEVIDRAFNAIKYGDLNKLRGMDLRPIINEKNNRRTMLHNACWKGHLEIVKLLLNVDGIDVRTPLYIACEKGQLEIVKLLLARNDIQIDEPAQQVAQEKNINLQQLQTEDEWKRRNKELEERVKILEMKLSQQEMEHNQENLQLIKQLSEQELTTNELFDQISQYQQVITQFKSDPEYKHYLDIDLFIHCLKSEIKNDPLSNCHIPLDIQAKRKIDKLEKELKECEQDLFKSILNDQQCLNSSQCESIADLNSRVNELTQKRNNLRNELLVEYENYDRVLNKMTILSKKKKFIKIYDASMNEMTEEDKIFAHSLEQLSVKSRYLQGIVGQKKEIDKILNEFKDLQEKIESCEVDVDEINIQLIKLKKKKKAGSNAPEKETKQFVEKKEKLTSQIHGFKQELEQLKTQLINIRK
ncbi:hypothetical protein FDP41_001234 [Naegleria fowleri]|nr:uncharacterized protein FDP41_001234 [Naegleria fowleri]KAF0980081.1 hypothetical protein FDP41_001234 [Naegleria fowleri]